MSSVNVLKNCLKDEKLIKKTNLHETETCEVYSRIF